MSQHFDVLVVGAGLSGVCAGYYLQTQCPGKSYAILESRDAIGGTWDLFRYPGVRSDSDMYTLGYSFHPWQNPKAIADGPAILDYVRQTAVSHHIDHHIRYHHHVTTARWSSTTSQWHVAAQRGADKEPVEFTCNFLLLCSGYYDYDEGHAPVWEGMEGFNGRFIHPQHWPESLDYSGKRVVVIGSGATAVTLVPAMTEQVSHITMLQRSPTYIVPGPSEDAFANKLHRTLPAGVAHWLARWKFILQGIYYFFLARRFPAATKETILKAAQDELGPDYDVATHLSPRYNPWDQRVCLIPDSDLFKAINSGKASIVTDEIDHFTPDGIQLRSGSHLPADLIVTATGLKVKLMGGLQLWVDDKPVVLNELITYKGMMYSNIPNLATVFGYTNASWTLKCELIIGYVCRLLNHMDRHGYRQCTPRLDTLPTATTLAVDLESGYIQRAADRMPRQSEKRPWRVYQNYLIDLFYLGYSRIADGTMIFS